MRKQWSPQCTKPIAEIYNNQSIKGIHFIKEGIKALKLELRVYKKIHLNQSFDPAMFVQDLRLPLRLEIHEEEAKSRLNFRVSNNVFRQIYHIKEKTGFTDSRVFEAFVYLVILKGRKSPIEPLVEERKVAPKTEIREQLLEAPQLLEEEGQFDCNKLCKKASICTSNAMFYLGEITASNCYVSKYPYKYKGHRQCEFMVFPNGFPHDPKNPYPECIHPKPPIHLPKDRIIKDPQKCWICYNLQKKAKEKQLLRTVVRGQPKVYWGESEGLPPSWYY